LLYTPAEAAIEGGWGALLGYCVAILMGPVFIIIFGPTIREQSRDAANITDWVWDRFGPNVHTWFTLVLIYYMFIYMTGQLKTVGDMVTLYTCPKGSGLGAEGCLDPRFGLIPVALVTMLYTMFGGLPASLATDQVQAIGITVIVIIVVNYVFNKVERPAEQWTMVDVWPSNGWRMGWNLCFAVFGAEVFNLAFWQRVYIAKDDTQLRIGFFVGAAVVAGLTFLFGLCGLILKAQQLATDPTGFYVSALTIFQINDIPGADSFIWTLLYILALCMVTSSVDSFQIGITSVITRYVQIRQVNYKGSLAIGLFCMIVVNIPAVAFALYAINDVKEDFSGLSIRLTDLFSMADIVTLTLVVPIFSGMRPYTTMQGCAAGLASGIATIIAWGWIEFESPRAGFEMITMMCFGEYRVPLTKDDRCGFYAVRATYLFPTIVLVTAIFTYAVSYGTQNESNAMDEKSAMDGKGTELNQMS